MKQHKIRSTGKVVKLIGSPVRHNQVLWQTAAVDGELAVYRLSDLEEFNEPPTEIVYDAVTEAIRAYGGVLTDEDMEHIVHVYNTYSKHIRPSGPVE